MKAEILKVEITNLRVLGKKLVGNLEFHPYHLFIANYIFSDGDVVVHDGDDCYIEMLDDKFLNLAYES